MTDLPRVPKDESSAPAVVRRTTARSFLVWLPSPLYPAEQQRGYQLVPLPSSREEVTGIATLFSESRVFLGAEATEENALSAAPIARYLHFACHGILDSRFPLNSALVLSLPEHPQTGRSNGLLQAWEMLESMRLNADLVTLSGCETALGKDMGGEGLMGLTRAFH